VLGAPWANPENNNKSTPLATPQENTIVTGILELTKDPKRHRFNFKAKAIVSL
jgi:hypothetical protein